MNEDNQIVPQEYIEQSILIIRGVKVMLDSDLASMYGVSTKIFNQAVKRNIKRFPKDFMFELTETEVDNLRSQTVTSSYGGRRYLPYVFTEYGVAMISSVLRSERAILVNIEIMRAFGRLRQLLASHKDLAKRLDELEKNYDKKFSMVFQVIKQLMKSPEEPSKQPIGFTP